MTKAVRWTKAEHDAYLGRTRRQPEPAPAARSKYGAEKVEQGEHTYDSKKEARYALVLEQRLAAGQISDLKRQIAFVLAPAVKLEGEPRTKPAIKYWADFTFIEDGKLIVVDVKSKPTRKLPTYRIKRHLMKTVHNLDIREI